MLSEVQFAVEDYVVCGLVLCVSIVIGLYYACSGGRQGTTIEYHLGNRNQNFLPVMFSLMVTSQSSILILGVPAEAYLYGYLAAFSGFGFWIAYWVSARIIIPVVHPLKITSVNEYFELRYQNNKVRILTTFLSFLFWFIYLGIVTFGVSTAIETVLGAPVWLCIILVSMISMVYTAIGGIKAVIWTDVIQYLIMFLSVLAVIIQGSLKVGGGSEVLRINSNGGRLDVWNFSADPTLRFTIWNVIIGGTAKVIAFPFSQSSIQRIGCMSSRTDAYRMFIIVAPLMALTFLLAGGMGLVSYAYFADVRCDPLASKFISNPNQILPTLVSEIFQEHPGMMGLFIAGLFCASLSTVSSGYAALSSMTLQDIIKKKWTTLSDKKATYLSKITVVVFSILTTGMSLLLANVKGTLLKLAQMVLTIPMAPYAGIFLYSIFCTSATTAGAIVGGIVSLMFYLWMAIGNIVLSPPGVEKKLDPAPVDMCSENTTTYTNTTTPLAHGLNITGAAVSTTPAALEGFNKIYSLSFQWFDVIAILLVIIVGLIVSKIVGPPKEEVDARYVLNFTEQFFPCLPAKVKHVLSCGSTIPKRRRQIKEEKQKTQHIVLDTKPSEKHSDSSGPGQTGNDP
ncbi:sodium-coupled monocarboxylate transporter 1-like isoform X1 [Ostrea edulis]|uniref:sodium-coupled monocarboxylate transporter 1-like isoform X1 n=1 Tax=Ostrea edulis TaxID=37623 RepID=UPI0024AEBCC8|nr:sodium-coupled monocarboxylate transporter 1-like isoform X1 [Ostrea edulis]XP_056008017.1 sodium-coupled monocarboxylate transporter 1-like isoform X1 [Ostrea edulis]